MFIFINYGHFSSLHRAVQIIHLQSIVIIPVSWPTPHLVCCKTKRASLRPCLTNTWCMQFHSRDGSNEIKLNSNIKVNICSTHARRLSGSDGRGHSGARVCRKSFWNSWQVIHTQTANSAFSWIKIRLWYLTSPTHHHQKYYYTQMSEC